MLQTSTSGEPCWTPKTLGASSTVPNLSSREVLRWSTSRQFSLFSMAPWVKYGEMGSEIWDSLHFMGSFMAVLNGKPLDFGGPSVLTNPNVPFDDPTMTQRSPQRIPSRNLAEEKRGSHTGSIHIKPAIHTLCHRYIYI